jgi:ABC-type multidrug transport system fused ATPase/permease subunit
MAERNEKIEFNFWQFRSRLWKLLLPAHGKIKKFLLFVVFVQAVALTGPYIMKWIIDTITNFSPDKIIRLIGLISLMFLVNEFMSLLGYLGDHKIFQINATVIKYLSKACFDKLIFLDLGYHEKENTGSKVYKVQHGIDRINGLLGNFFWDVAPTVIQVTLTTITLFIVDWRFGLTLSFFVPIFVYLSFKVNRDAYPTRVERHDLQEDSAGFMAQSIININAVKSFVQERRESKAYFKLINKVQDLLISEYSRYLRFNLWRNLVIDLGRVTMLFFGIFLVYRGSLTVGSLVFVYTISEKALFSLYRISRLYDQIMESGESVSRLYTLMDTKPGISPRRGRIVLRWRAKRTS